MLLMRNGFMFVFCLTVGLIVTLVTTYRTKARYLEGLVYHLGVEKEFDYRRNWPLNYALLTAYTIVMILIYIGIGYLKG